MAELWDLEGCPRSWYRVCGSRELRPGAVRRWDLLGRSLVVWRGRQSGEVHALAAHCTHMGTHLAFGEVVGDTLRCPLHHWQWGGDGACRAIPGAPPAAVRQRAFPVVETQGSIYVFHGPVAHTSPPGLGGGDGTAFVTLAGSPVSLACPWYAVASNGFDMQHMRTVHGRALRHEPRIERLDRWRLTMRLETRVTGRTFEDRVIRWLSRDHVRLTVTCFGGTVVAVESRLGRIRTGLLLCLHPTPTGVDVTPVYAIPRSRWAGPGLRIARALYSGFIRKDVAFMDDMRFRRSRSGPADPVLETFLDYLQELPLDSELDERAAAMPTGGFA